MKTRKIILKYQEEGTRRLACGLCFTIINSFDNYCSYCGAEFDFDEAYNYTDLSLFMDGGVSGKK